MKKSLFSVKGLLVLLLNFALLGGYAQNDRPDWVKDLIVYEVSTRAFTSPNGPQSGTFKSLQQKLPYLEKLGINGIWLAGTNLADDSHFYNIWTQYACVDPGKLDPVLGMPDDFKALVDAAHKHGIRVFMDVITHGVMSYSPLIKEHPDWFKGGSWGMTDFDFHGNKPELDEWWVKIFTDYVTEYGVDGYRLDVDIIRPDLWARIKKNAADAGHPIAVFTEGWNVSEGASDFLQRMTTLTDQRVGPDMNNVLHRDVARFFDLFTLFSIGEATVYYTDNTSKRAYSDNRLYLDAAIYSPAKKQEGELTLTVLNSPAMPTSEKQEPIRLRIEGVDADKVVQSITFRSYPWYWIYSFEQKRGEFPLGLTGSTKYDFDLTPFVPDRQLYSIQLSSHDDGWDTFPLDKNPYAAQGSRSMFGYSCLLTPAIPLFMSGEEFNADYVSLPSHTPGLFGEGEPGKGRWLYASMIDWNQLKQKSKQQMLDDVTRMIAIRKADADLFAPVTFDQKPRIKALPFVNLPDDIPVPYMLYGDAKAIIVCGNPTDAAVKGTLEISLADTPLQNAKTLLLTDLWNGKKPVRVSASDLKRLTVNIKPDRTPRGGLAVYKIEVVE